MNRGSETHEQPEEGGPLRFNEAPIHESGKSGLAERVRLIKFELQ